MTTQRGTALPEDYGADSAELLRRLEEFLEGDDEDLLRRLKECMEEGTE